MPTTYEAGEAYLSVLPSMRGFLSRLKREMAGVNVSLDVPVGVELDRRALTGLQGQLRTALRALPVVVLDADSTPADREIAGVRQRIEDLAGKTVGIDISADAARAEVESIQRALDRLASNSPDIGVRVDAGAAQAALAGVEHQVRGLDGRTVRLRIDADVARALIGTAQVLYAVNQFAGKSYKFKVEADTFGAVASVAALVAKVGALGGLGGVVGGFAGALGGLGAAGAVAGAGLASTVVASLGVGDALSALNAQQDGAGAAARQNATQQAAAADAIASAQGRVKQATEQARRTRVDGERSVAEAVDAASRQIDQAERGQASAQRNLRQATSDLKNEQAALTDAWEAGRRSLQDLQSQVTGNSIDQRQAAVDLRDAEKDLAAARNSGDADAINRATIAYDRQKLTVDDLARRGRDLGADNKKAQAAGVEGSDQVVAANDRIAAATVRQQDAIVAARDADAALVRARTDGAEQVARAREQADQRNADSTAQVAEAQRALTKAMTQSADAGQAAADKVNEALSKLSPEAAGFARFLFDAKTQLEGVSRVASAQFFPPLQAGLQALLDQAPEISRMTGVLAGATGGALQTVLTALASPTWMRFYDLLASSSTTLLPMFAQSLLLGADVARELLTALLPLAPAGFALLDQFLGLIRVLSPFIVVLLQGLIPAASAFLSALTPLGPVLAALQPILLVLGQALATVLLAVLQAAAPILVALTPLLQEFARTWAEGIATSLRTATPLLVTLFTWLSDHAETVVTMIGVVGGLVGALKPLLFFLGLVVSALHGWLVMRIVSAALAYFGLQGTLVGTIITRLLSPISLLRMALPFIARAIMFVGRAVLGAMGPFGILLTILGYLFTSNEQFRTAIQGVLGVLLGLGQMLIAQLMPAFNSIMGAIQPLIPLLVSALMPILDVFINILLQLIQTVLPPLVAILTSVVIPIIVKLADIFAKVLVWVITNVVVPALTTLASIIADVVVPIIMALWQNVIQPIFKLIGDLAVAIFTYVVKPLFEALVWTLENIVGPAFLWLWQNIIKPTFDGIAAAATWLWQNGLKPAFDFIIGGLQALADFFGWVFEKIITPIFVGFSEFMSGNVAGLDKIWSGIKAIFTAPVKFVLDIVWNAGIGGLWDMAKKFGLPLGDFPRADTSKFAEGGRVPGNSPTRSADNIPALLTADEYVQPVAAHEYYGTQVMDALRARAIPREQLAAYALGGPVTPDDELRVLRPQFPGIRMTSGYRPGDPGYHGQNKAADFAGPRSGDAAYMGRINQWIASNYPRSLELIYTPGINLKNGQPHQYSGRVAADHYDHVHWAAGGMGAMAGGAGVNFTGSGSGTAVNWFTQQVQNLFDTATDGVKALVEPVFPRRGNFIADLPMNSLDWGISKVRDFMFGKAKVEDDKAAAAGAVSGGVGGGVERWRPVVMQALQMLGLPGNLADTTLRRMNQESGGNPRAINNWDSNAKKGIPSKGLMQVIDPTFRANRDQRAPNDIWDPLANVLASMHYALGRYHSLPAAYDRKGGYDQGGIGKGIGWMWKGTGLDERVLDPVETQAYPTLTRLSRQLEAGRLPVPAGVSDRQYAAAVSAPRGSDVPGGDTFNLYDLPYPPERIAREVQRQRDRKARRGGS